MENDELNELRNQMAALKEKLDKETIVNDRLMRESTKAKTLVINRQAWISGICALFVIVLVVSDWSSMGISVIFCCVTIIYMLFSAFMTWWMHRGITKETINGDLLTVAKRAKELKANYNRWIKFAIPSVIVWAAWFFYEMWNALDDKELAKVLIISGIVGGVIGSIIGWRMHKKVVDTCDDIIRQIEE